MKRLVSLAFSLILLISAIQGLSVSAESPLTTFAIMSDTHVTSEKSTDVNGLILRRGLEDLMAYDDSPDALIIAGDLTEHGKANQYEGLRQVLHSAPIENIFTVMGNHDAGRDLTGGYEEAFDKYKKYCSGYGINADAKVPYYDKWIKGYHFIFLCTEADVPDQAYISQEQVNWLEEKLAEDASLDKPIFVISHHPLKNTFSRTQKDSENIGPMSNEIRALIEKYPQVIFMSGHVHNGFGYMSHYINEDKGVFVNIPPAIGADYGYTGDSVLYYVEIYRDRVVFCARDFGRDLWLEQYNITIALHKGLPAEFELKEDSEYRPRGSYITGVLPKTEITKFLDNFTYRESLVYEESDLFLGTGHFVYNEKRKKSIAVVIEGEVDGNGVINTRDYLLVKKAFYSKKSDFTKWESFAADADNDGCISDYDCLIIKRKFAGG